MPECKEKSTARLDTLRAFLTRQAGIFCQKHRRNADCQQTLEWCGSTTAKDRLCKPDTCHPAFSTRENIFQTASFYFQPYGLCHVHGLLAAVISLYSRSAKSQPGGRLKNHPRISPSSGLHNRNFCRRTPMRFCEMLFPILTLGRRRGSRIRGRIVGFRRPLHFCAWIPCCQGYGEVHGRSKEAV